MPLSLASLPIRVNRSTASPVEWDAFATRAGASFRCAYRATRAWQWQSHRLFRLRRLELIAVDGAAHTKIGQCAVGVGRRLSVFADGIQLSPDHADAWPKAMAAVLEYLGSAAYVYGSEWSLEPARDRALLDLAGVSNASSSQTSVHVIDFSRWASFDAYVRSVSSNIRRNVGKAQRNYPKLELIVRPGLPGTTALLKSLSLRIDLFRRKRISRSAIGMAVRSFSRLAMLRQYSEVASLTAGSQVLSSYVGVHFGSRFAYLEGASDPDGKGVGWFLLMAMIERAFRASAGQGRFIMGSDDGSQDGVEAWEGLRRSRRQCCATPVETSVVRFRYRLPTTRRGPRPRIADFAKT